MAHRIALLFVSTALLLAIIHPAPMPACCPVRSLGVPVVNADQTVIILWDAAKQTQHFIRKASFKTDADDFGFIVPSPSQPDLEESGNEAFPYLAKLTEPRVKGFPPIAISLGCSARTVYVDPGHAEQPPVTVLQQKEVAGFDAVVLEARSAEALAEWLHKHGYTLSKEVQVWARPYVEQGWKFTALKVARDRSDGTKTVAAAALRISFKTDRPLFPYREPDPRADAETLGAKDRLLRIYFIAEARYRGAMTKDDPWTGKVVWADKLKPRDRKRVLELLKLPPDTGPSAWWLTEFEDHWPYRAAPADVYFSVDPNPGVVHRPASYASADRHDASLYALAAVMLTPCLVRRVRSRA